MRRVGIDLALRAPHRATVYEGADQIGRPIKVARTREGIDSLVRRATAGSADGHCDCEFIMEPTGLAWLPLAAELERRGYATFVPKPQKTAALRKFLAQFAKTDTVDARAQALVRHVDPKGVHRLHVPTAAETTLRMTVKQRARLVVDAARAKGRIQSWLVLANPDLCEALRDPFTELGTALLRKHVDPFTVRALGKKGLRRFCQKHADVVDEQQVEAVWNACETACEMFAELRGANRLPFDYAHVQAMVRLELERIESLELHIAQYDELLKRVYAEVDPEKVLERVVPGIGPTIAPTIEGLVGSVERFGNVKQFAAFFGLVPRTSQTGGDEGKPRMRLSKGGQRLLKQYMFLAAESARRADPELAETYARAIARGKHHYASVIAVAHKLVRKVYAILKLRAAARGARAEGREPKQAVAWRYVTPDGELLSAKEARAWVATHHPSVTAKAAGKRAPAAPLTRSVPQGTGSSCDATNGVRGELPAALVAGDDACGKDARIHVEKPPKSQANKTLAST